MKKVFAFLMIALSLFSLVSCGKTDSDNYYIGDSHIAEVFSSYPKPQEIFDKVSGKLENYDFNTDGLTSSVKDEVTQYFDENSELVYEVSNEGNTVKYYTFDSDNMPIIIEYDTSDEGTLFEEVIGENYKIIGRKELSIYGKEREMIYYVLEDGIWNMSEATYYDEKGMETYFFESNRLFAEKSEGEEVTADKILTEDGIVAAECVIGGHKFTVTEEDGYHVIYLKSDFYAVFDDKAKAESFAEKHQKSVKEWKDGYFTVCFKDTTLRLADDCENLDYNPPEDGQSYFRNVVFNEAGEITDFNFDGPTLIEK